MSAPAAEAASRTATVTNPRLAAALDYAARSIAVFPIWWANDDGTCGCGDAECADTGKHPFWDQDRKFGARNGVKNATTNPDLISAWWRDSPRLNIGLSAAGFLVADLDGDEGQSTLATLVSENGKLPLRPISLTGGGGSHHFFRPPPGRKVKNVSKVRPGLDFRGAGGYVIAPPSRHASGRSYAWAPGFTLDDYDPPEAPAWLADLGCIPLKEPRSEAPPPPRPKSGGNGGTSRWAETALQREVDALRAMAPGTGRNHALNRAAFNLGQIAAAGHLDRATCEAALMDASRHNGYIAKDGERACRSTFESGWTAGAKTPRDPRNGHDHGDAESPVEGLARKAREAGREEDASHGGEGRPRRRSPGPSHGRMTRPIRPPRRRPPSLACRSARTRSPWSSRPGTPTISGTSPDGAGGSGGMTPGGR